jgi:hypothetical protein
VARKRSNRITDMPPYKKPVSKAQAKFFGAAAGGEVPGFDSDDAKKKMKGVKESKLPARKSNSHGKKRT